MGFTREELQEQWGRSVPDVVGPGCRLLFVGINPGLWTAATQTHFAHPGNRFYPALHRAGITEYQIDRGRGFSAADREYLIGRGVGITNLVNRATARADDLAADELREGAERLARLVAEVAPRVVAIAGIGAYRVAFRRPKAVLGPQPEPVSGAQVWVVPNPSGLNAHATVDTLAGWYRRAAVAAGVL